MKTKIHFKIQLLQYFALYQQDTFLYMTNQGAIFRGEELEKAVSLFGADNIATVSRSDLELHLTRRPV